MPTELEQLIREAARQPAQVPDVGAQWRRGRRRRHVERAARSAGAGVLMLAALGGFAVVADGPATLEFAPGAPVGQQAAPSGGSASGSWADLTAAEAFARLANAAAAEAETYEEPAGFFYHYQRTQAVALNYQAVPVNQDALPPVLHPREREIWVGTDGSGRIHETAGTPRFLSEEDRHAWEAAGETPEPHQIRENFGPGGLAGVGAGTLPRDIDALEAHLRGQYAPQGEPAPGSTEAPVRERRFTAVSDLFRDPALTPDLRATALQVAARVEGFVYLGEVTDPAGRPAIGFAYLTNAGQSRYELFFAPATGAPVGERHTALGPLNPPPQPEPSDGVPVGPAILAAETSAEPPFVLWESVLLEGGIVTELPPAGG